MYGIPEEKKLQFLLGKELIQICIGSNQVVFQFEFDLKISIEVSIKHGMPDMTVKVFEEYWNQETTLTLLLGSSVKSLHVVDSKILHLEFSNGHFVEIKDESLEYESFQITIDDQILII